MQKLARQMIFGKGYVMLDVEARGTRKKLNKFKESAWKCVYFSSAELFALSITYDEPWFTNTKYFWVGPGDQVWPDQKIKLVPTLIPSIYQYKSSSRNCLFNVIFS